MAEPIGPKVQLPVGEWSLTQKLELLRCYLGRTGGFLRATTRAGHRYYIDLFSGPGEIANTETGEVADGSPLISLKLGPPTFDHVHWVEQNADFVASLRAHAADSPGRAVTIYHGDANERVKDVLQAIPRTFPTFAFLDPRGPELEWKTVQELARHKASGSTKIELLLLFAYNTGIVRLMPNDASRMVNEHILDRFMPDPEGWRRIYERRPSQSAAEYRRAVLDEYVGGLQGLGYKFVPPPYLVHTPDNHPLYFLIFASDHPAGWSIMKWCLDHLPDSRRQPSFFPYTQRY